jgi:hypothetical protein
MSLSAVPGISNTVAPARAAHHNNPQGGVLIAKGVNGQLALVENRVRISRKGFLGFMTQGHKGDKEILIASINAIQFKRAGAITSGYIQFSFPGGSENKGGLFDATKDENTVMFKSSQQRAFEIIKQAIENRIEQRMTPHAPPAQVRSDVESYYIFYYTLLL